MKSLLLNFFIALNDDLAGVVKAGHYGPINIHDNLEWKVEYGDAPCDDAGNASHPAYGTALVNSF